VLQKVSASHSPCILDDDPAQLELMIELVASAGFEAVATSDPEEALQLVRSGRARMIFAVCAVT
jgi:CheY-like chemotaxis protein